MSQFLTKKKIIIFSGSTMEPYKKKFFGSLSKLCLKPPILSSFPRVRMIRSIRFAGPIIASAHINVIVRRNLVQYAAAGVLDFLITRNQLYRFLTILQPYPSTERRLIIIFLKTECIWLFVYRLKNAIDDDDSRCMRAPVIARHRDSGTYPRIVTTLCGKKN